MDALATFFGMGGYALYVWSALGLTAAVMVALLAQTLRTMRARESALEALKRELPGRGPAGPAPPPA